MTRIPNIRACVFDAYGTLFDFAAAAAACRDALGDKTAALAALWRDKQLQYSWLRTLQNAYVPFERVTADALDFSLRALDISPDIRPRLLALYETLTPFPEVPALLQRLQHARLRTAILSNGSPAMLAPLVVQPGLAGRIDHVISVDSIGAFKTDPRAYQLAVDRLALPAAEICFFSSNAWDAWAASAFGFRVIWCNRTAQPPENLPGRPDAEVRTLTEALPLLGLA